MRYTEKYNRLHTEWDKASTELNKLGDFVLKLEGEMEKEMEICCKKLCLECRKHFNKEEMNEDKDYRYCKKCYQKLSDEEEWVRTQ